MHVAVAGVCGVGDFWLLALDPFAVGFTTLVILVRCTFWVPKRPRRQTAEEDARVAFAPHKYEEILRRKYETAARTARAVDDLLEAAKDPKYSSRLAPHTRETVRVMQEEKPTRRRRPEEN
jgi:hypothetical protein